MKFIGRYAHNMWFNYLGLEAILPPRCPNVVREQIFKLSTPLSFFPLIDVFFFQQFSWSILYTS